MKFKCVDELNKFGYSDAEVSSVELSSGSLKIIAAGLISKYNNPCNNRYQDCYIAEGYIRFTEAEIIGFIKEGMKYYNANDVLINEVPDSIIEADEYAGIMSAMKDNCYMYGILDKGVNDNGNRVCEIGIDIEDEDGDSETYWIEITYDKAIIEWDRYAGRVNE